MWPDYLKSGLSCNGLTQHCGSNQGTCFSLWLVRVAARMSAATRQWAPKSARQMMADDENAMLEMETEKEKRQLTPAKTPDREAKKQNIAKEEYSCLVFGFWLSAAYSAYSRLIPALFLLHFWILAFCSIFCLFLPYSWLIPALFLDFGFLQHILLIPAIFLAYSCLIPGLFSHFFWILAFCSMVGISRICCRKQKSKNKAGIS